MTTPEAAAPLTALLDDVRFIETTLIRESGDRYDESAAALSRIQTYLIHAKAAARATSTPAGLDRDSLIALIEKHCDIGDYGSGASDPEGLADAILALQGADQYDRAELAEVVAAIRSVLSVTPDTAEGAGMHRMGEYVIDKIAALQGADR
jgi:hypothetical protein